MSFPKPKKRPKRKRDRRPSRRRTTRRDCDRLWSKLIKRDGVCYGLKVFPRHVCKGPLQAAHGFSRRYAGTRHDLRNGFPLCAALHVRYTYDPIRWDNLLRKWWGLELYEELKALALQVTKPDYGEVLARSASGTRARA